MKYKVILPQHAAERIDEVVSYFVEQHVAQHVIEAWLRDLLERIDELSEMPRRFVVDEDRTNALGYEVRRFNQGEYIVFYRVQDDIRVVKIEDVRHGRRQSPFSD